jgi:hypothetical protein
VICAVMCCAVLHSACVFCVCVFWSHGLGVCGDCWDLTAGCCINAVLTYCAATLSWGDGEVRAVFHWRFTGCGLCAGLLVTLPHHQADCCCRSAAYDRGCCAPTPPSYWLQARF